MNSPSSPKASYRISPLFITALVCLSSVACMRKLDPLKVVCSNDKTTCPKNYHCVVEKDHKTGLCRAGSATDAGAQDGAQDVKGSGGSDGSAGSGKLDAQSDGKSGGSGGSGGVAGTTSSSPVTGGTTADSSSGAGGGGISWPDALPPTDAPGSPAGTVCTLDSECSSGHCTDGVCCAAVSCTGCFACSNALTDQADGTCAPVANGKSHGDACSDETSTKPCGSDGTCDGKGECRKAALGQPCGKGSCNADQAFIPAPTCDGKGVCASEAAKSCSPYPCSETGCAKKCTDTKADCDPGNYCDTATNTCKATKPNGTAATDKSECTSGILADGVCCNEECTGCSACVATMNGQDSKTTGTCRPVTKEKAADPHKICPKGTDPCGTDGTCDGNGHCSYLALGADCGTKSCTLAASIPTLSKSTCDSTHTCKPSTGSCPGAMACLANGSDCRTGACADDTDCATGYYCVKSTGTCTAKSGPGSLCTPASASQCNGGACVDGHCCTVASCGTCEACTGTGGTCQKVTNAEDTDSCTGSQSCDITGACKKKNGQACTLASECLSTYCADKVCCDRACNGSCEYCNSAGAAGACSYITGEPKTGHTACAGDGSCQGTCKGGKADCDMPGTSTVCRQSSCQSTSTQINQAYCTVSGTCPSQTTQACGMYTCSGTGCLTSCTGGGQCSSGACINGSCQPCGTGNSSCGTYCADLTSDPSNCGSCAHACPSSAKFCKNGGCVACTTDAQCVPLAYMACLSGSCVCRQKSSTNMVQNPGFDSTASPWVMEGDVAYAVGGSNTDADGCPGSGSAHITGFGNVHNCFYIGSGSSYYAGFRYRGVAAVSLGFYSDSQCQNFIDSSGVNNLGDLGTWTSLASTLTFNGAIPAGATYAGFWCSGAAGEGYFDQFWFNTGSGNF